MGRRQNDANAIKSTQAVYSSLVFQGSFLLSYHRSQFALASEGGGTNLETDFTPGMYLDVHPCLSASYPALTAFPERRAEQEVMKGREAKTKQRTMEESFMKNTPGHNRLMQGNQSGASLYSLSPVTTSIFLRSCEKSSLITSANLPAFNCK